MSHSTNYTCTRPIPSFTRGRSGTKVAVVVVVVPSSTYISMA